MYKDHRKTLLLLPYYLRENYVYTNSLKAVRTEKNKARAHFEHGLDFNVIKLMLMRFCLVFLQGHGRL